MNKSTISHITQDKHGLTIMSGKGIFIFVSIISQLYALRKSTCTRKHNQELSVKLEMILILPRLKSIRNFKIKRGKGKKKVSFY